MPRGPPGLPAAGDWGMLADVMTGRASISPAAVVLSILTGMFLQAGCENQSGWERLSRLREEGAAAPPGPEPQTAEPKDRRIAELQTQVDVLRQRIEELSARNDRLAQEVRNLRFCNNQLRKQLEVVGDAPRQRDKYQALAAALEVEVRRLRKQVQELEKLLKSPQEPASQPGAPRP